MSSGALHSDSFSTALSKRGINAKYHALLSDLIGGEVDYLADITAEDLQGRQDAEGSTVTAPVARGLLRMLANDTLKGGETTALQPAGCEEAPNAALAAPALMRSASQEASRIDSLCRVSLSRTASGAVGRDGADALLVRCALRGTLPRGRGGRRKLLAIVLDRSGSMAGAMWRRVIEAVVGVVTDELLQDQHITVALVVYSDEAQEVRLPSTSAQLRDILLSREYSPQGGTSFKAAFELTRWVLERELDRQVAAGLGPKDVDIATLVFTDGEDTSVKGRAGRYGVRLVDRDASLAVARTAGDAFREALRCTGCQTYICIAAFGADHDPDQCQYLSDRYYYINRGEALAEVLAGGLGALLSSAGQCSVSLALPSGASLEEPLPAVLPLDAAGCLDHHVWLRVTEGCHGPISAEVEVAGVVLLRGASDVDSADHVASGSFEDHLFLVDLVALRLRRVARQLCGRKKVSAEELSGLRERLTQAKATLQPTKDTANAATGHLRGRAALRERLAEIEAARERLSYALGQFDERDQNDQRTIGSVALDAILRDAGQHVPQGPVAAALGRRADAALELPVPEKLSKYGTDYTTDAYSCCDAWELASQGDALFFQLGQMQPAGEGGFCSAEEGDGLIAHEAFVLLSRDGRQAIKNVGRGGDITFLGLPLYVSQGHFLRAQLLLPEVLRRLTSSGAYQAGVSERQFLSLLGRALVSGPGKTESQIVSLVHKARAVFAILSSTPGSQSGVTLLDDVVREAEHFVAEPGARPGATDLFAVAAAGLLADGWDTARLKELANAVVRECLRRRIAHALRGSGESQRLCLAWALLGPQTSDAAWLDRALPCSNAGEVHLDGNGINPFDAPRELEALESDSPGPGAPRQVGAEVLLNILSSKCIDNNPQPQDWGLLNQMLSAWGGLVDSSGSLASVWQSLDALMIDDNPAHLQELHRFVAALRHPEQLPSTLRSAFGGKDEVTKVAMSVCLPDVEPEKSLRLQVAARLRAIVERRTALVHKYPITGADFPKLETHSGETVRDVWGAPANPVDPALHRKAMLRVYRRTMKAGISMTTKEALADKEYRKRGGSFAFPSPMDTFIRGLHRRTMDLHQDWRVRLNRDTSKEEVRREALAEMLLRLRWDDSDQKARKKLAAIVGRIWDGLEGVDLTEKLPLSSALWLDDAGGDDLASAAPSKQLNLMEVDKEWNKSAVEEEEKEAAPPGISAGAPIAGANSGCVAIGSSDDCMAVPSNEDFIVVEPAMLGVPDHTDEHEKRTARDDSDYTRAEFLAHYGAELGEVMWEEAGQSTEPVAAAEEDGSGREGGNAEGDDDRRARAEVARAAMDAGLQATLDSISVEVRRRMDTFASDVRPGSRIKLPLSLTAKQRKAIHLWAEIEGLTHKSFGYRGRRRLHLSVLAREGDDDEQARDFDDAADWDIDEDQDEDAAAAAWD